MLDLNKLWMPYVIPNQCYVLLLSVLHHKQTKMLIATNKIDLSLRDNSVILCFYLAVI